MAGSEEVDEDEEDGRSRERHPDQDQRRLGVLACSKERREMRRRSHIYTCTSTFSVWHWFRLAEELTFRAERPVWSVVAFGRVLGQFSRSSQLVECRRDTACLHCNQVPSHS